MTPDRVEALYRRLRPLFPRSWRSAREHEFIATLHESAQSEHGPGVILQTIDLLWLAAVLRRRELADGLKRRSARRGTVERVRRERSAGVLGSGPTAAVLAFALLLLVPVLGWGGHLSMEFVLTTLLVVAVPGIGVLYTVSCALAGGRSRGLIAAMGCTLGIVPHLAVAFLGLSGLMQLGATLFEAVRWAGVLYLAWMGVTMLRCGAGPNDAGTGGPSAGHDQGDSAHPGAASDAGTQGAGKVILRGVLLNVLNPKLTLFFFAFLPQFLAPVPADAGMWIDPRLIGLGSLFMLLTLVGFVLYALAGSAARDVVLRAPRALALVQRSVGVLLLGFAARLALTER